MNKTPNYNLNKPSYDEPADIVALNENADIIDAVLAGKVDKEAGKGLVSDTEKATWDGKSTLALGETSSTAYRGDRGKAAYDHITADNPHGLGGNKVAIGRSAIADGDDSTAVGYAAKANGTLSSALGAYTTAGGITAFSIGYMSEASEISSVAIGRNAYSFNERRGVLGGQEYQQLTTFDWLVPGNLTVSGTKDFEIPHPHPDKKNTHMIRHGCVESPTAGDNLYRFTIIATEDNQTVEMQLSDYFKYLNKNVDVWVNGHMHFGRAFGWVDEDILKITCEMAGEYKCLVIGTRNDDNPSIQNWDIKGVEREIGESWIGETYAFSVDEIIEVEEIKEVVM